MLLLSERGENLILPSSFAWHHIPMKQSLAVWLHSARLSDEKKAGSIILFLAIPNP